MRRPGETPDGGASEHLGATLWVFLVALAAFAPAVTRFEARVTDLSALRILDGDVPYRDFWTMYAPGSFVTLALAFKAFGRELLVSNVLGVVTSAAATAAYFRLARSIAGGRWALLATAIVGAAFVGSGYHDGFTSYPPALLLILAALHRAARGGANLDARGAVAPGLLLGAAAFFKHDIAAYATLAVGAAALCVSPRTGTARLTPTLALGASMLAVVSVPVGALVAAGAGADVWRDLVVFPTTDFRHVRPEYFPLLPRVRTSLFAQAREVVHWAVCNLPLVAAALGVTMAWRSRRHLTRSQLLVAWACVFAFGLHWMAAHVQINTHAITLAALGALVAAVGFSARERTGLHARRAFGLAAVGAAAWMAILLADPAARWVRGARDPRVWVGLPHLRGIRAPAGEVAWMRGLAREIAGAAGPRSRLLLLGNRNDVLLFADSTPYWLSDRRPATAHHELHPGITDTEPVQRRMLQVLNVEPLPVLVREHRFGRELLDAFEARVRRHVPIGSPLVDDWVAAHYERGARFGMYEIMRSRSTVSDQPGRQRQQDTAPAPARAAH